MTKLLELIQNRKIPDFQCLKVKCLDWGDNGCTIDPQFTCQVIEKMRHDQNFYEKDGFGGGFFGCEFCKHEDEDADLLPLDVVCAKCVHYANNNESKFELQLEYKDD